MSNPEFLTIDGECYQRQRKIFKWTFVPVGTKVNCVSTNTKSFFIDQIKSPYIKPLMVAFSKSADNIFSDFYYYDQLELAATDFMFWSGENACPFPDGVLVEVMYRNDYRETVEATDLNWIHSGATETDIIAYRVVGLAKGWEYPVFD